MNSGLTWLELRQLRGGLRDLGRSPGRLIAALLVVGMLLLFIGMQMLMFSTIDPVRAHGMPPRGPGGWAAMLLGLVLYASYQNLDRGLSGELLTFTASEVDFLFAAPLPRRDVLVHRLVRLHVKSFFVVGLVVLWVGPQLRLEGAQHLRGMLCAAPLAAWLYFVFLTPAAVLAGVLAAHHPQRLRHLQVVARAGFTALGVTLGVALWSGGAQAILALLDGPVTRVLLYPLAVCWRGLASPFSGVPPSFQLELLGLGLLAAAVNLALVRRPENIYEPAIEASLTLHAIRSAMKSGDAQGAMALARQWRKRSRAVRALRPFGHGAMVLVWKGVAQVLRGPLVMGLLIGAIAITAGLISLGPHWRELAPHLAKYAPYVVIYALMLNSGAMFRQGQSELQRAELLQPLPLPSWKVVAAQLAPSVMLLTIVTFAGLSALVAFSPHADPKLCLAVALMEPPTAWLAALLGSLSAALLPGADNLVHRFVGTFLMMIALGFCLSWVIGVGVGFWMFGSSGLVVGLAAATAALLLAVPLTFAAGRLYRRFDPTD